MTRPLTISRSVLMSGGWWIRLRALRKMEVETTIRARELIKPDRISARWNLHQENFKHAATL